MNFAIDHQVYSSILHNECRVLIYRSVNASAVVNRQDTYKRAHCVGRHACLHIDGASWSALSTTQICAFCSFLHLWSPR